MLKSQKIAIAMSEKREAINTLDDDAAAEEFDTLTKEYGQLESRYRGALTVEGADMDATDMNADTDSETRELRSIERKAMLGNYLMEAVQQKHVVGAERELRAAIMADNDAPGKIPLQMLLSRRELDVVHKSEMEHRAVTPVAAAALSEGSQETIAARVFSRSIAGRLGIPMPTVPVGSRGYPYLATGTTVSQQSKSGEQLPTAGSFSGAELKPLRLTGGYEFRIEDQYELRGLEESLRMDLRSSLSDSMDSQVISGDGTAPNVSGILKELTAPMDPGSADDFAGLRAYFTNHVDGIYSYGLEDMRIALGTHGYTTLQAVYRSPGSDMNAYASLASEVADIFVSSRMPAVASNISTVLIHKTAYPGLTGVAPVWNAFEVIRDPYTGASKGETKITAVALWNFKLIREDAFELVKLRSA